VVDTPKSGGLIYTFTVCANRFKRLKQLTKFKHLAVSDEAYELVRGCGSYGDTMDSIISRIASDYKQRQKGELIIS
jgi:hypothetical protein